MTLSAPHRHSLEVESSISPEVIAARGYWTETTKAGLTRLGFSAAQALVPCLVVPLYGPTGEIASYQIRPDAPRIRDGKPLKYETPTGSSNVIDIPPPIRHLIGDPTVPLWITEGGKKADSAASRGICCIDLAGVWNWRGRNEHGGITELADWGQIALKGTGGIKRKTIIAFDSDSLEKPAVMQAMLALGRMLAGRGADVRYLLLRSPDGRKIGLDDHFAGGGDVMELLSMVTAEPPSPPINPRAGEPNQTVRYENTDLGNAHRLIDRFGDDIHYVSQWGKWLTWDGKRWASDETGGATVHRMAHDVIRSMLTEAMALEDLEARKEAVKHAIRSQSKKAIDYMIAIAQTLRGVPATPDEFDRDLNKLNVKNGTLDLVSLELHDFRRSDMITKMVDAEFDNAADCPRWIAFLDEIFQSNPALMRYVMKALGYSLTGSTSEKCFFFLHGERGDNGKSTFIETITAILSEYAQQTPVETLMVTQGDKISNDVARLKGARFVAAPETDEGRQINAGLVKRLTGGDTITARFMRAEFFEFKPEFKIWMTGNHKPVVKETDNAMWRRIVLIPFLASIPPEKQDKQLGAKLLAERDGILAWMIDGLRLYITEGLVRPDEITRAVAEYREESDVLGTFLNERTTPDSSSSVSASEIYESYMKWAKTNGLHAMSNTVFGKKMRERGLDRKRDMAGNRYVGLVLNEAVYEDEVYRGSRD